MTEPLFSALDEDSPPVVDAEFADLPPPPIWSAAAVRLLQGVVYLDDGAELWDTVLRCVTPLTEYFARLGLRLVVDESDAMAFLRQSRQDEFPHDYDSIPKLFRRSPLNYDTTLLCVLLRDELRRYEEEVNANERCVVSQHELLAVWKAFFPSTKDEVRLNRSLTASLKRAEELKFVRPFGSDAGCWEIRRIIKARLPLDDLERIRESLVTAIELSTSTSTSTTTTTTIETSDGGADE